MQLTFSRQIIAAAIVAIVAPSATTIGAQSFSDFVSAPRPYVVAQEFGSQPGMMGPSPGGFVQPNAQPTPRGEPQQPQQQQLTNVQPLQLQQPLGEQQPIVQPPPSEGFHPGTDGAQPPPSPNAPPQPFSGGEGATTTPPPPSNTLTQPTNAQQQDTGGLERCARDALGDAFDAMKRGEVKMTEGQRKMLNERCEQFKPAPKQQQQFPGRGEFRGQTPGGGFPGQGQGLERAPGAPSETESSGSGQQTCNVNGVEMPGPCSRYEQRGSEGGEGPGGFGPSEEDMDRMEKERKTQMLKEMKRNIRGMAQGYSMMTRGLKVCTTAKVEIPAEVKDALTNMQTMIAKIKSATDPDELGDMDFSEFAEVGDKVRELVDGCHRIREIPRITREITREVKRVESNLKRVTSQAKRARMDVGEQLGAVARDIAAVKALLTEVASARSADAVEEAMEKLESLREVFDEVHEQLGAVQAVLNVKRGLTDASREIKNAERRVKALERRKVDVTELKQLLTEGKALVAELTALAKQKPLDPDALIEAFEKLGDLGDRADDAFAKAEGRRVAPQRSEFGRSPAQDLKLGAFEQFRKQESAEQELGIESLLGF